MGMDRYVPNRRGIKALLGSEGVRLDLVARGERVAEAAQSDYDARPPHQGHVEVTVESEGGKGARVRARAAVVARHPAAQFIERDRRPLGSALDAAG